ncbi:MAG: MBL fold metallo-hydrolase [Bauldia sp.]|nr:MBL fold metallo-hydrolase [Verrucomicrobiae bacterium]MCB1498639.1 MBL fold metallo-hydrolase [Bauldia sp.]
MSGNLFASSGDASLQSSIRGLHATPTAPLPFLRGVVVRSFVLERARGNVIVYHSPGITAAAQEILRLGRPERLLVNHWHEAMFDPPYLDVPIFVHQHDRGRTDLPIAGIFSKREKIADDLEIIPTPGHTSGATMFLWDNGERRVLFPGDSIWVEKGEWKAVLLGESDREAYIDSLSSLMDLDFDLLVPWASEEGRFHGYGITRAQARSKLQRIVDRLRAGEDG